MVLLLFPLPELDVLLPVLLVRPVIEFRLFLVLNLVVREVAIISHKTRARE